MNRPYYLRYENRYRAVQEISPDLLWGHSPEDEELRAFLSEWVGRHRLTGRKVVEFCCGEGAGGVVLSELGCAYQGYDVAPSAIDTARRLLSGFPGASADVRDLIRQPLPAAAFDAAFDSMGLHMLVADADRAAYLKNMFGCLKPSAPAFFFHESYREDAYSGPVASFDEWKAITGCEYDTPEERSIGDSGQTAMLPLIPARARKKADYIAEMEQTGFIVDRFMEMGENRKCVYSASIFVHKP